MDLRIDLGPGVRARPDVVFTKARVAVFYDSCFWHCCPMHGRLPTVHEWYWRPRLARNAERDRQQTAPLAAAGWEVVRIWEHDDPDAWAARVEVAIQLQTEARSETALAIRHP